MVTSQDGLPDRWHNAIICEAEQKLGRPLQALEKKFIVSHRGYLALEMIHDTIKAADKEEIENYLRSECK